MDIWWQIPEGFRILSTFHLPTHPVGAFGLPANPYFDEYAGYEVVVACVYQATGFMGIWILSVSTYLAIMFLPSLYARKDSPTFNILSCLVLLFASVLMRERLDQRPELVGTLLQVLLMVWLRSCKLEDVPLQKLLLLFVIFAAWANVHSSFTIGWFTLALWAACEFGVKLKVFPVRLLVRNGSILGAVALLATLFNPYGITRLWFPFAQVFDPGATILSPEMWPIDSAFGVSGICVLIASVFLAWIFLTSKKAVALAGAIFAGLHLPDDTEFSMHQPSSHLDAVCLRGAGCGQRNNAVPITSRRLAGNRSPLFSHHGDCHGRCLQPGLHLE